MDSSKQKLNLDYDRRFGVEIELNSLDHLVSESISMSSSILNQLNLPKGVHYIGDLIHKICNEDVTIHTWGHDHNNQDWIVKPDSSCGIEVCTPVMKGWNGLLRICKIIEGFSKDSNIRVDSRCSLHVHVDVSDLTEAQIASIVSWWIKCEPVFLDSVPSSRKKNKYCQFLGETDIFYDIEDGLMSSDIILKKIGHCKYYTINTFHYQNKKRKTIEFRIMDSDCCLNPWMAKNWIRLVLHFVEMAVLRGLPSQFKSGDKWSGYCWLDPFDVFDFLGFSSNQYELSAGLQQVRSWFLSRLQLNSKNTGLCGVMSDRGRRISQNQINQLCTIFNLQEDGSELDIYSDKFCV